MRVVGTNTWDMETDTDFLIDRALEFSDMVKERGHRTVGGCLARTGQEGHVVHWLTDDLDGLQAAFEEMNQQTGLTSELAIVEEMFPNRGGREEREAELSSGAGTS